MEEELLDDIEVYLKDEISESDTPILSLLIEIAVKNVKIHRNYPDSYKDEMISKDLEKHYGIIFNAVINSWNKQGVEGESSHSESGTAVTYINDDKWYAGVIPIARLS